MNNPIQALLNDIENGSFPFAHDNGIGMEDRLLRDARGVNAANNDPFPLSAEPVGQFVRSIGGG